MTRGPGSPPFEGLLAWRGQIAQDLACTDASRVLSRYLHRRYQADETLLVDGWTCSPPADCVLGASSVEGQPPATVDLSGGLRSPTGDGLSSGGGPIMAPAIAVTPSGNTPSPLPADTASPWLTVDASWWLPPPLDTMVGHVYLVVGRGSPCLSSAGRTEAAMSRPPGELLYADDVSLPGDGASSQPVTSTLSFEEPDAASLAYRACLYLQRSDDDVRAVFAASSPPPP